MEGYADAIELAFKDCLLSEFTRYRTTVPLIPHVEGEDEEDAEYLGWKGANGLWFSLFVTNADTQIVCEEVPSCTHELHQDTNWLEKLKAHLSEPQLTGYFPPPSPSPPQPTNDHFE
jgi:hypothetical protein